MTITPDKPVLRWIDKRGKPSYAATGNRWGHYLDSQIEGGFVAVEWIGVWRESVALTDAGKAAIAPKPKRARDATQPTGQGGE